MNEPPSVDGPDRRYIEVEGLNRLAEFDHGERFAPCWPDLVRLHKFIRARRSAVVLEFGVGWSTIIIADALRQNERDYGCSPPPREARSRFRFQLFSVDASQQWISKTRDILPPELAGRVHFQHSEVKLTTHNGQLCHCYQDLPDIVPDFVYLDGPDPKDVQGSMHGLSFQCDERTVMAADLLLMESTFLPGLFILVDGRTNNARFLKRSFQRCYKTIWDREGDVTTFELVEEPLFGGRSRIG